MQSYALDDDLDACELLAREVHDVDVPATVQNPSMPGGGPIADSAGQVAGRQ